VFKSFDYGFARDSEENGDFGGRQKVQIHTPQRLSGGNRTFDLYRKSDLYLLVFEGADEGTVEVSGSNPLRPTIFSIT
jgi:hypothetical protein